ncbi:MAG: hypothetical protein AAGA80_15570 [Cyanobacteria bacterium P01_F01_bin.143]
MNEVCDRETTANFVGLLRERIAVTENFSRKNLLQTKKRSLVKELRSR